MASVRTLLVIGDNHKEIAAKYSNTNSKDGDVIVRHKLTEAPKLHFQYLQQLDAIIRTLKENLHIPNREVQIDMYTEMYDKYSKMDDFEFYESITQEFDHDENGDAITYDNPNARYECEACYDEQVKANPDNEAPFSDPFILNDGTKAYSAKVDEIDWDVMHYGKADIYRAVWELCVEGREPVNDDEKTALQVMGNKKDYFSSFNNVDEYVGHCSAFWTYGVATEDRYEECHGRDIEWTNGFYDRYIKPLPGDTLITLYEMKLLD